MGYRNTSSARYTIVSGDSLWTVAQRFGVTVEDLKRWNGLKGDALQPGQQRRQTGAAADSYELKAAVGVWFLQVMLLRN